MPLARHLLGQLARRVEREQGGAALARQQHHRPVERPVEAPAVLPAGAATAARPRRCGGRRSRRARPGTGAGTSPCRARSATPARAVARGQRLDARAAGPSDRAGCGGSRRCRPRRRGRARPGMRPSRFPGRRGRAGRGTAARRPRLRAPRTACPAPDEEAPPHAASAIDAASRTARATTRRANAALCLRRSPLRRAYHAALSSPVSERHLRAAVPDRRSARHRRRAARRARATSTVEEMPGLPAGRRGRARVRVDREARASPPCQAARALARALGVNERDVGAAGMKDRARGHPPVAVVPAAGRRRTRCSRRRSPACACCRPSATRTSSGPATCAATASRLVVRGLAVPGRRGRRAGARGAGRLRRAARQPQLVRRAALRRRRRQRGGRPRAARRRRRRAAAGASAGCWSRPTSRSCSTATCARRIDDGLYRPRDRRRPPGACGAADCSPPPSRRSIRRASTPASWSRPARCSATRCARRPTGSEAAAREEAILDEERIAPADFRRLGQAGARHAAGQLRSRSTERRGRSRSRPTPSGSRFALPAGAYATAVMREIMNETSSHNPRTE